MRFQLLKTLPRAYPRAWLGARFHGLAMPSIIRRHPGHSAGIAGAALLGGALLILVLQAHTPAQDGMEASAGEEAVSTARSAESPVDETATAEGPITATATAASLVERASLQTSRDTARPAPDAERWAAERQQRVRRVDEDSQQEVAAGDAVAAASEIEPDSSVFDIEPDRTVTAAIDPGASLDDEAGQVAIAESEVEVAALETRMADEDSAVFAATTATEVQGQALGQGLVTSYVNMRAGPENDAEILKVLPQNAAVSILDECPNWCQVEHDGTRGFIYGSFVERGAESDLSALDANGR